MGLRVLLLMNRVPWPAKDGGTLAHYNLYKGLADAGCKVTLAALNTSKHFTDTNNLPPAFTRLGELHTAFIDNRVKPIAAFLNLFSDKSYHVERFISSDFKNKLIELLKQQAFDLIIADGLFMAPYIATIRQHSKVPVWLREHNVEYRIWETLANQTTNPLKKWYITLLAKRLKRFEQEAVNRFDALITLTQDDEQGMRLLGCTKPILVAPVGMVFNQSVSKIQPLPLSVFHLGAMDWQPNQQAMLWFIKEVWPMVTAVMPDAVFYMAGKSMPASFKQYQSKSIKVVGEVDDASVFMLGRQVMIVPLFAGSGIRVKILEGMSLGKAIVTTSLGGQGIQAEHGKHLLVADDAATFAKAILMLLADKGAVETMGKNAQQLAFEVYDNNKVTEKLLKFYNTQSHA